MNRVPAQKARRLLLAVLFFGGLLVLGLAFPRIAMETFIQPVAMLLWLMLRIFVLSIDQEVYWWCAIAAAAVAGLVLVLRLDPPGSPAGSAPMRRSLSGDRLRDPSRRYRESILANTRSKPGTDALRRELSWLLASLYASPRPGCANYEIREALLERRIPLPQPVYDFLFAAAMPRDSVPSLHRHPVLHFKWRSRAAAARLRDWTRRRSGQDVSDYLRSIDHVLRHLETTLEMNHELERDS